MNIFMTGASGYVGGSVAARLLAAGHRVKGLVRTRERADLLQARGIDPVLGDLSDLALLTACARESDAVVSAANADDRASVQALLAGLSGSNKTLVHTSGSGVIADCAGGAATDKVYDDDTPVDPMPLREARAKLNRDILAASHDGVRSVVIAPPMIYGTGLGLHVDSIQIPLMLKDALRAGRARFVGEGLNRWSNVHVADLADLYLLAVEQAPNGLYCYAENGGNTMHEIASAMSRAHGLGPAQSLSLAEAIKAFGETAAQYSFGSNSRVRARKARAVLGWQPSGRSLLDEIEHGSYAPQG